MNLVGRYLSMFAVALAGASMAAVTLLASRGHDEFLMALIPWAFGLAGIFSLAGAYLEIRSARKGADVVQRAAANAEHWAGVAEEPIDVPWWRQFKADVDRKRVRSQQFDVEGWWLAQNDRLAHDGLYSILAGTLIVVGIVFTFMGVRDSAGQLSAALEVASKSPANQSARNSVPEDQPKKSVEIQAKIGKALRPLKDAFGANLVGIVFALGLMLGSGWLRFERRKTLEALRRCLLDEVEPLLDAEWELAEQQRRLDAASALAEQLRSWQETSQTQQAEQQAQLLVVMRELARTAKETQGLTVDANDRMASMDETTRGLAEHLAQRLTTQLAPVLREQLEPSLAALSESLQRIAQQSNGTAHEVASAAVNAVADGVRANYDAALEKLIEVIRTLDEWSSANLRALKESSEALRESAVEQQSSFRLATTAFDGLRTVMPELQDVVEGLDGIVTTTHELLRKGEEGTVRAAEGQQQAAQALAGNSQAVLESLQQLQALPAHVRTALDASAKHLEGVLARSDTEAQARLRAMQDTIDLLAERQASQAATTQQSIREFAEQMGSAVAQVVDRARVGLGDASAQVAEQLQNLVERSGDSVATSAEDLSETLATGIKDLQTSFSTWRDALTNMAGAVQRESLQQEQRMAAASRAIETTASALRLSSDAVQKLPGEMNSGFRLTNDEFQRRVAAVLSGLTVGVDGHLTDSVKLLAAATQNLEVAIKQLDRVAKGLEQTAGRLVRG